MGIQTVVINGMSLEIPDYYQKVDSMPDDPKDSVPCLAQTEMAICFALLSPIEISEAMPQDKDTVLRSVRHFLNEKQGIIQVEVTDNSVYTIIKTLKEPAGVIYTLTYQRFFTDSVLNVQTFFEEAGTTGIRDSMAYELGRKENLVGNDDDPFFGWTGDPYDKDYKKGALMNLSEQEAFDEVFPESPLSMCRELLRCLESDKNSNSPDEKATEQAEINGSNENTEENAEDYTKDNTVEPEVIPDNETAVKNNKCDKYDYIAAACCGWLAGIIDVIFVRDPSSSKLVGTPPSSRLVGKQSSGKLGVVDRAADGFVKKAAQFFWKHDKRTEGKSKKMPETLSQSISYLEQAFPVNYDARYASDLNVDGGVLTGMTSKNHHLHSLAHSPDIIGFVFSIIDQYSKEGSGSFMDKGRIIRAVPKKTSGAIPYLQGSDQKSKLFCGFVNWIGHMISDMVGSSSTRQQGKNGRGMGIPMPFYNMFLLCDFGNFNGNTFAETMIEVYEKGYDLRFGIATSIPLILEELMVRIIWVIRQKFFRKKEWRECFPTSKHDDLRMMLIVGNGAFCLVDGTEAAVQGVKDKSWVTFFCHLNLAGWIRFTILVIKEAAIRLGIINADQKDPFMEKIFGKLSDDDKQKITKVLAAAKEIVSARNYIQTLKEALKEQKLAREERIRIEAECEASILKIKQFRQEMTDTVEDYLEDYMLAFNAGFNLMDEGIAENDGEKYIQGNILMQNKLGYDTQFKNIEEFCSLMDNDEETFKL